MPRKKPDQGIDELHEKFKPHVLKLAQWLRNTIEQHDENVNAFVKKAQSRDHWSLPSSTFYQICRAQAVMSPDTAKKASYWLKRLYGVRVDYTDLLNMIEDAQAVDEPPPRIERDILPPTTIDWHFQRLPFEERALIWPNILNRATKDLQVQSPTVLDLPLGRNIPIDVIAGMIHSLASRKRATTASELVKAIKMDEDDTDLAITFLYQVLVERRWPYQNSPEYIAFAPALAAALGFEGETELAAECGLILQDAPDSIAVD